MDSIIKKYRPEKQAGIFDPANITKDGVREVGLEKIAKDLFTLSDGRLNELSEIRAPQKRLYVMIIGNHSAGKSSFINWYVGENI